LKREEKDLDGDGKGRLDGGGVECFTFNFFADGKY
jgi:hypothetical protein